MQPAIELARRHQALCHAARRVYTALRDLDMRVMPGEFCAVVGPTGCGKSTTLGLISGLEHLSAGQVLVGGKTVDGLTDGIGYVFQSDAVFPWKTVLENVAAGPRYYHGATRVDAREAPATGSSVWASPALKTATRTSCRAACASAWRWRRA